MRLPIVVTAALLSLCACGSTKAPEAPKQDDRVKALEDELAKTKDELAKASAAADEAHKAEAELKAKADESAAVQAKLAEAAR